MEPEEHQDTWPTAAMKAHSIAQAQALRVQAKEGGLRFEVYLPSQLADWLLGLIEEGVFIDPSEAVFVMLGEQQELEPHADLRQELLKRRLRSAIDDPRPSIDGEDVFAKLREKFAARRPEPAVWKSTRRDVV